MDGREGRANGWEGAGGKESLAGFVPQCHLDYGSQEDGNQARYLLSQVGATSLHLHLLGEQCKQKCFFFVACFTFLSFFFFFKKS